MPGKFINEITGDTPAKDDLAVFFDKSKNATAQASIAEIVNAGLDLAAGAKGQVPTIDVKVDAATSSLVNILTWGAGGGVDFKGTPTRPPAATDEILTNDPVNGLVGKTTLQQLVVAGGATILQPGTAVNTALTWNDTAGKWEPARAVSEAKNINGGATGELPFQLNTHVTAWIPLGNAGQVLTIGDIGAAGSPFIAPMWSDPVNELPAFTIADKGKQLTVKADGKATEWVEDAKELPTITSGLTALQTKADKSGVEWVTSVNQANQATNLKGGFTAGAFFPVNDTKTDTTNFVDAATFRHLAGVPEGYEFNPWAPVNKQINEFWPSFSLNLTRMNAEARATFGAGDGNIQTPPPAGTYPGSTAYIGGVLLPNGKVFCVPHNATSARIYDPATDTLTTPAGTYPGSGAYTGGVLLPNGKVFCVPHNATSARIYDPVTDTLTTPAGAYPGSSAYVGGVLLPNGKVFCVPHVATSARIYDPATDTLTTPAGTYPVGGAYAGGVLLPNGKVFCVPFSATSARIYDPVTDTLTTPAGTYPGSTAYYGGVLLPNGKVFCVPLNATSARIYDPATDTLTTPAGTYPGGAAYIGSVLLPSGKVFCVPHKATSARIYDPATDTLTTPAGAYPGSSAYTGGVLLPSGKVFCVPHNATSAIIAETGYGKNIGVNFCTSPYFDKL